MGDPRMLPGLRIGITIRDLLRDSAITPRPWDSFLRARFARVNCGGILRAPVPRVRAAAFVLCVVALGAVPSPCLGAEGDPGPIGPRLGFVLGGAYGQAHGGRVDATALNAILQLDLGITIGPHLSVYALGEAGTIIFVTQAAAYAIVEWAPIPRFSLGTG